MVFKMKFTFHLCTMLKPWWTALCYLISSRQAGENPMQIHRNIHPSKSGKNFLWFRYIPLYPSSTPTATPTTHTGPHGNENQESERRTEQTRSEGRPCFGSLARRNPKKGDDHARQSYERSRRPADESRRCYRPENQTGLRVTGSSERTTIEVGISVWASR